jgi:hypothetical protein
MKVPSMVSSSVPRQPGAGRARGQEEQRDLAGGVEAQAEEDPERVHLPRLGHRAGEAPQQAVHEPARAQQVLELGLRVRPAPHVAQDAQDPDEDDQVECRDHVEEGARDPRADQSCGGVQGRAVVLDLAGQRANSEREEQRQREDHGRVPEREEEPDAQRPLAVVHELARRVVDGGDVVGVEGVAQPEGVRREPHAGGEGATGAEAEVVRHDDAEEQAEADHVQRDDRSGQAARTRPLDRCQRGPDAPDHASSFVAHAGHSPASGKCVKRPR